MKRCFFFLMFVCLLLPLLTACGSEGAELILTPLDPGSTPVLSRSEQVIRVTTPFGPAVPAVLPSPPPKAFPPAGAADSTDPASQPYVLNTNSKRFHLPDCSSVSEMKPSNREDFTGSREELLARGYKPCGRCKP